VTLLQPDVGLRHARCKWVTSTDTRIFNTVTSKLAIVESNLNTKGHPLGKYSERRRAYTQLTSQRQLWNRVMGGYFTILQTSSVIYIWNNKTLSRSSNQTSDARIFGTFYTSHSSQCLRVSKKLRKKRRKKNKTQKKEKKKNGG